MKYITEARGARIQNCTIVNNSSNAVIVTNDNAIAYLVNCIVANSPCGVREANVASRAYASYCCFSNSIVNFVKTVTTNWNSVAEINALTGCSNNIVADPRFRNITSPDFRLGDGSPCYNAGSPTTDLTTDFYGNPRRVGIACDIGSYEMPPNGTIFRAR